MTVFMVLSSWHTGTAIARIHLFHLMKAEQRQMLPTFGPSQSTFAVDPPVGSYSVYSHHCHILLFNSKADAHFTIPWSVAGLVDLAGWLHTKVVYLSALCSQSPIQVVTGTGPGIKPLH